MSAVLTALAVLIGVTVLGFALLFGILFVVARRFGRRLNISPMVRNLKLHTGTLPSGTRGEIARLRLRIDNQMRHTHRVIESRGNPSWGPDPFPELGAALTSHAATLDRYLALLEHEPDAKLQRKQFAALRLQAELLIEDATALRDAAYGFADHLHESTTAPVNRELRDRINGLGLALKDLRPGTAR